MTQDSSAVTGVLTDKNIIMSEREPGYDVAVYGSCADFVLHPPLLVATNTLHSVVYEASERGSRLQDLGIGTRGREAAIIAAAAAAEALPACLVLSTLRPHIAILLAVASLFGSK